LLQGRSDRKWAASCWAGVSESGELHGATCCKAVASASGGLQAAGQEWAQVVSYMELL